MDYITTAASYSSNGLCDIMQRHEYQKARKKWRFVIKGLQRQGDSLQGETRRERKPLWILKLRSFDFGGKH